MTLERFDEIAEFFDEVTETRLHWRLRRSVTMSLRPLDGRRVLDLGTGPGGLALELSAAGAEVIGLDGAPEMLRRAKQRLRGRESRPPVHLVRGDAALIPLADGAVDAVGGVLVIHLLDDKVEALRECRRVLVPGGKLALVTQSDDFGPGSSEDLDQPIEEVEQAFLEGCLGSAESHPRLDRQAWEAAFYQAGWSPPTITIAVPSVAWLLFAQAPGGADEEEE